MMKLATFAAVVAVASAACPGQCSGHGRCGEYDKCICNRQVGTQNPYRFAFTGPDCSLRTCPVGKAYDAISTAVSMVSTPVFKSAGTSKPLLRVDYNGKSRSDSFKNMNRDQKFVVKVMSAEVDATGALTTGTFAWKWEEDEYYGPETKIVDSTSAETARYLDTKDGKNSGVFVWFDKNNLGNSGWDKSIAAGDVYSFSLTSNNKLDFDEADANSAHQEIECSGRGVCDYSNGKCKCADGYTGEACQRTACPNQCSGHGQCYSEGRFVTDAGDKALYGDYSAAYDAQQQYGCKCDAGYRGPDCSQIECPSGADILGGDGGKDGQDCSGRGLCDYSTGICKCFKGYYGERCESQTNFA